MVSYTRLLPKFLWSVIVATWTYKSHMLRLVSSAFWKLRARHAAPRAVAKFLVMKKRGMTACKPLTGSGLVLMADIVPICRHPFPPVGPGFSDVERVSSKSLARRTLRAGKIAAVG